MMRFTKFISFILVIPLWSCNTHADQKSDEINDTTCIEVSGKSNMIEFIFYQSLLDSFPFENYKVTDIYTGKIAELDLTHYKETPKDILENILYQYNLLAKPNFAGHFIIVSWGCGSPCQMNAIIDVKTGNTIATINTSIGLDYLADSYLLVKNPPSNDIYDIDFRKMIGDPRLIIFKDNKLVEIK